MNSIFTAKYLQTLRNKKGNKGFTLIELLVVVIIVGVLAAVALPNLLSQVGKAREVEGKTGVGTITRNQQTYHFGSGGQFALIATDTELEDVATNPLNITVDSEYFEFTSTPDTTGTVNVETVAVAPDAATASANGTRTFASRLDFDAGNFFSILCQTDIVTAAAPTIAGAAGAQGTCDATATPPSTAIR